MMEVGLHKSKRTIDRVVVEFIEPGACAAGPKQVHTLPVGICPSVVPLYAFDDIVRSADFVVWVQRVSAEPALHTGRNEVPVWL